MIHILCITFLFSGYLNNTPLLTILLPIYELFLILLEICSNNFSIIIC
jgi:hypothetical protein